MNQWLAYLHSLRSKMLFLMPGEKSTSPDKNYKNPSTCIYIYTYTYMCCKEKHVYIYIYHLSPGRANLYMVFVSGFFNCTPGRWCQSHIQCPVTNMADLEATAIPVLALSSLDCSGILSIFFQQQNASPGETSSNRKAYATLKRCVVENPPKKIQPAKSCILPNFECLIVRPGFCFVVPWVNCTWNVCDWNTKTLRLNLNHPTARRIFFRPGHWFFLGGMQVERNGGIGWQAGHCQLPGW